MATIVQCPYCPTPHRNGQCTECGIDLRKGPVGCKHCPGNLKAGDIVCLKCGMNLLTGQRIAEARQERQQRQAFPWAAVGIAAAAVAAVAAIGGAAYYFLLRDPVASARQSALAGNELEAIDALGAHLAAAPQDYAAQLLLGRVHAQMNNFQPAVAAFEAAAALAPDRAEPLELAVAAAAKLPPGSATQRQTDLLRRLAAIARDGRSNYLLGLAYGAAGDRGQQIAALEAAKAAGYDGPGLPVQLAAAHALDGNFAAAAAALSTATTVTGEVAAVMAAAGGLEGKNDPAAWEQAAAGPGSAVRDARLRLAATQLAQGAYEAALETLRALPPDGGAPGPAEKFLQAVGMQALGMTSEALAAYQPMAEGTGPWAAAANVQMAEIFLAQGEAPRAAEYLRRAGSEKSARALTLEGRVSMATGLGEEAQQKFRQAIALEPAYAAAHLESGLAFVAGNDVASGVRELEEYLRLARAEGDLPQANEVELLLNQLRQSIGGAAAAP